MHTSEAISRGASSRVGRGTGHHHFFFGVLRCLPNAPSSLASLGATPFYAEWRKGLLRFAEGKAAIPKVRNRGYRKVRSRSLSAELMLLFFIFFLIPYGLLTFFSVSTSKEMMKKSTMDHLQNLVEVKETAIEQWLKERVRDGKTIAESREIKSLDPKRIEPFLSLIKHFERAYLDIWVLNLKGQIISGSGNPSRTSFEKEEWFQRALKEGAFISMPAPALEAQSPQPTITISVAIKDTEGRPIGVLRELVVFNLYFRVDIGIEIGRNREVFYRPSSG